MADKLFADQIRELEKGLKSSSNATDLMKRNFAELDKFARQLASSVDDLQDNFKDVVDISKQYFDQSKGILHTNIQNVDISKEIAKAQEDNNHAFVKYLKGIEGEFNQKKKIQKQALKQLDTIQSIGDVAGQIPMFGGALSKIIGNFGEAYKDALGGSKTKPEALGKSLTKAFKGAGLAISLFVAKGLFDAMQQTGAGLMDILKRPEFILFGNESRAIAEEFGNLEETSMKLGFHMKMMALFTGVSAENQAKIMGMMAATSDSSLEVLQSQMMAYKQAGVPFRAIMDDVANNMEFTAKFAKDSGANIFDAAKRAKELGINLGDVSSISSSLLDFESSIEKQMEAQVLLGRNLNLDKARQLAFTGDNVGLQNEILRQVGSEAEFNKMNYLQREALAGAIGLSVERLGALVRVEKEGNEETQSKFKWYVGIGAAAIGIASAIIGALTMGLGVKASLKGALKGGIGGGIVGAGIGATAYGIMNSSKVPKLAGGGIVNTPTLAMVGEKGPEAVVPLGAQGVNVDMKETNTLLRALLGSSERQVNRLGDIGTS